MIVIYTIPCPNICFHIILDTIDMVLLCGGLFNNASLGSSVANAREAKVFMIRFIHSIYTAAIGDCFIVIAPTIAVETATTFAVSWNCMYFLMLSYMFLPHLTATTIDAKLSSSRIISATSLDSLVPWIPMANPISAFFNAGASLVPSPVTATTCPS
mmetsp:Transcript_7525/g.961  ORF Transcript_7525/g.961 Transcript_7525/m.961 type:complete len:157 (-) Transcript_7525:2289-2759(-)